MQIRVAGTPSSFSILVPVNAILVPSGDGAGSAASEILPIAGSRAFLKCSSTSRYSGLSRRALVIGGVSPSRPICGSASVSPFRIELLPDEAKLLLLRAGGLGHRIRDVEFPSRSLT